jgi:threonine/homoserine/homoserine lactone efflux protein
MSCPEIAALPDAVPSVPPIGWILLSAVLVYLTLDLILYLAAGMSMSRWILNHSRASAWFRWLGVALLAFLGWHWFFGLPSRIWRGLRRWSLRAIRPVRAAGAP